MRNSFFSICLNKIFQNKKLWIYFFFQIVKNVRRFSDAGELQHILSNENENKTVMTIMSCPQTLNISISICNTFGEKIWTATVIPPNRKWRHQNKKRISNFNKYLSLLTISWKTSEPFPRNSLYGIREKNQNNNNWKQSRCEQRVSSALFLIFYNLHSTKLFFEINRQGLKTKQL